MKKVFVACGLFLLMTLSFDAYATEYGDLFNIKWCPCNPDDKFSGGNPVVLGSAVMCPCDAIYDGYGRSFMKDMKNVKDKAERTANKIRAYKYYIGFEYNKSQVENSSKHINFSDGNFLGSDGIDIPASQMIDHHDNIGVVLGFRPHKNFGFEAFYNTTYNDNEVTQVIKNIGGNLDYHSINSYTSKYQAYGIDLVGYIPVTRFFDFVAFVGLGKYKFENTARFDIRYMGQDTISSETYSFDEDELGYRAGGGVQFNIATGVELRLMYKYINIKTQTLRYLQEYSASLRFLF